MRVAISLGGNLGDSAHRLRSAADHIARRSHVSSFQLSSLYRSDAVGAAAGDAFHNAAAVFDSSLSAEELLQDLHSIENQFDRRRDTHWGPRTLDLDLILYGQQSIWKPTIKVPHPHCWYRRFVVEPLCELWPEAVYPQCTSEEITFAELRKWLHSSPFRLGICGEFDFDLVQTQVAARFSDVEVVRRRDGESARHTGGHPDELLIRADVPPEPVSRPQPFTLIAPASPLPDFVIDVLRSARGRVERLQ